MTNGIERMRRAINESKATAEGLQDISGGATRITGEFLLKSSGEKRVSLNFPVAFTDKPILTFSGEIPEGDVIVNGDFPMLSILVSKWITRDVPPLSRVFIGCELALVVTGPATQKMIIYWALDGNTIVNVGD